jgi:transglutaminase-like putative cysteine protease
MLGRLRWLVAGVGVGAIAVLVFQRLRDRLPYLIPGKITPHDPVVRRKAIEIASKHQGEYNVEQMLDVFDHVRGLNYVSDPEPDHVAYPRDTILAGGGDCDDFAVTTASLIMAIGGRARVAVVSNDKIAHAFAEVYVGSRGTISSYVFESICNRYGDTQVAWECDSEGNEWLVFDTLLPHPGMLPQDFTEAHYSAWKWKPEVKVQYFYS